MSEFFIDTDFTNRQGAKYAKKQFLNRKGAETQRMENE